MKSEVVTIGYDSSSDGGDSHQITLLVLEYNEPCIVVGGTDPLLTTMVNTGLIEMRNRDGKFVAPEQATLVDWVRLLDSRFTRVRVLEGQIATEPSPDPQDQAEVLAAREASE